MRKNRIFAGATVIAAALALTTTPAQAETRWSSIRYVAANKCGGGPCGPWQVSMLNGTSFRLADAQVHPLSKRGNPIKDALAPIGVNGQGTRVAYLRKSDGRLVVRDTGGAVFLMPRNAFAKDVTQRHANLWLSLDGAKLALAQGHEHRTVKLYDVASGTHLSTLPKGHEFLGFSGDGGEVLSRTETGSKAILYSHTLAGAELARSDVPGYGPYALNADGVTVAYLTKPERGKGRAVLWDLVSDSANVRTWVWIPDYEGMIQQTEMLDWTADKQLTLHVVEDAMRSPRKMRVLQLDLGTSRFSLRDRYTVRKDAYGFESCGG